LRPELLVQVYDRLRVAVRLEAMPACDQVSAQVLIAVNFSVEDHPDGAVFVRDRLVSRGQIDNAEPPHADAAWPIDMEAFIVRSAVAYPVTHLPDLR